MSLSHREKLKNETQEQSLRKWHLSTNKYAIN